MTIERFKQWTLINFSDELSFIRFNSYLKTRWKYNRVESFTCTRKNEANDNTTPQNISSYTNVKKSTKLIPLSGRIFWNSVKLYLGEKYKAAMFYECKEAFHLCYLFEYQHLESNHKSRLIVSEFRLQSLWRESSCCFKLNTYHNENYKFNASTFIYCQDITVIAFCKFITHKAMHSSHIYCAKDDGLVYIIALIKFPQLHRSGNYNCFSISYKLETTRCKNYQRLASAPDVWRISTLLQLELLQITCYCKISSLICE